MVAHRICKHAGASESTESGGAVQRTLYQYSVKTACRCHQVTATTSGQTYKSGEGKLSPSCTFISLAEYKVWAAGATQEQIQAYYDSLSDFEQDCLGADLDDQAGY